MNLQTVVGRIRTLQAEREVVAAQVRSRKEASAELRDLAMRAVEVGKERIAYAQSRLAHGHFENPLTEHAVGQEVVFGVSVNLDLGPLLVAAVGVDRVVDMLLDGIEKAVPVGLDAPARKKRLAEIDAELDKLERQEEALIRESRGALARRSDARPEIVLELIA